MDDLQLLSRAAGSRVRVTAVGGEVFLAKVRWVEAERRELVFDLISTTMPERYEKLGIRPDNLCVIPFEYIDRVEAAETLD